MNSVANGPIGTENWQVHPNNFIQKVYPILKRIKADGRNLFCFAGDLGNKQSYAKHLDANGIEFHAFDMSKNALNRDGYLEICEDNKGNCNVIFKTFAK